jgi:hypothetical protein
LIDGKEATEYENPITLTVKTKCPSKWLLTDMETGEQYVGYETQGKNSWKKVMDTKCQTLT